jgi:hypothetical protein
LENLLGDLIINGGKKEEEESNFPAVVQAIKSYTGSRNVAPLIL